MMSRWSSCRASDRLIVATGKEGDLPMKVFHVPLKPKCPLRIQMSDDEVVAAIQVRDEQGYPFYWQLISPETARRLIEELGMKVVYNLPDTTEDQVAL